jgi:cell envelope opacity-associated protein A
MNQRTRSKRHTELIIEKWNQIEWKKSPTHLKASLSGLPKLHRRALFVLVPITLVLIFIPTESTSTPKSDAVADDGRVAISINTRGLSEQKSSSIQTPMNTALESSDTLDEQVWVEYVVKSGDTLANVFRANNLTMTELNALAKIEGVDKPLSQIKQGQLIRFKRDETGHLDILQLEHNNASVMFFRLSDGGFGRSK